MSYTEFNKGKIDRIKLKYINNTFPHAILFCGHYSYEAALNMAQYLLCKEKNDLEACGVCSSCKKISSLTHPDILILNSGEGANSFHIDQVRSLCKNIYISANESDFKVYILNNVNNMTIQAQNAILKILEAPPDSVIFLLACTDSSAIIDTILSRVTIVNLNDCDISSQVHGENTNSEIYTIAKQIATSISANNECEVLFSLSELYKSKERQFIIEVFSELKFIFLKELFQHYKTETTVSSTFGFTMAPVKLCNIIELIEDILLMLDRNSNKNILLTYFSSTVLTI